MIISSLQLERPQRTFERLLAPSGIAGRLTAGAGAIGLLAIGMVRIETLLDRPRGQAQCLPANRRLQRFQIQIFQALAS